MSANLSLARSLMGTLLIAVSVILPSNVLADIPQIEPVKVAVDEDYPPYMYRGEAYAKGLYPRLIEAVFSRMGRETSIIPLSWKRALLLGENGEGGVAGIYMNQERLKIYDYSAALYEEKLVLYVKKGHAFAFSEIEDLRGKMVGLNFGWSYGDAIDAAKNEGVFNVDDTVTNNESNFRKLIAGRVDCLIVDELAARRIISKQELEGSVEQLDVPISVNAGYLVFSKKLDNKNFLEIFNRALNELHEDGTYKDIVESFIRLPD